MRTGGQTDRETDTHTHTHTHTHIEANSRFSQFFFSGKCLRIKKQGLWELFVAEVDARTGEVRNRRDGTTKRRTVTEDEIVYDVNMSNKVRFRDKFLSLVNNVWRCINNVEHSSTL
jgi:hypothetical protein